MFWKKNLEKIWIVHSKIYANTCYFIFLFQQLDMYLEYQVLMLKEATHIHYKHRMKRRKNNG